MGRTVATWIAVLDGDPTRTLRALAGCNWALQTAKRVVRTAKRFTAVTMVGGAWRRSWWHQMPLHLRVIEGPPLVGIVLSKEPGRQAR